MEKPNWTEDPNTKFECEKCGCVWLLGKSIGCPKCDGTDGGILLKVHVSEIKNEGGTGG